MLGAMDADRRPLGNDGSVFGSNGRSFGNLLNLVRLSGLNEPAAYATGGCCQHLAPVVLLPLFMEPPGPQFILVQVLFPKTL